MNQTRKPRRVLFPIMVACILFSLIPPLALTAYEGTYEWGSSYEDTFDWDRHYEELFEFFERDSSYEDTLERSGIEALNVPNFPMETLAHGGKPDSQSVVITIMGDGFAANEQDSFMNVARTFKDTILASEPFNSFTDSINIYAIRVVSNISTASVPNTPNGTHYVFPAGGDTSMRTYFGVTQSSQAFNIPDPGKLKMRELLSHYTPAVDMPVLFVNTGRYGGLAVQLGGGFPNCGISTGFQQNPHGLLLHELGHSYGGLGDEYNNPGSTNEARANQTQNSNTATVKWRALLGIDNVGVNPFTSGASGWFRPRGAEDCRMGGHTGMTQPFCRVCRVQLTRITAGITGDVFFGGSEATTFANIPNGKTRIVEYAFYGCSQLRDVNIGSTVSSVGQYSFLRCTALSTITSFATVPPSVHSTAFFGVNNLSNITLRVPEASITAYRAAAVWKDFNIIAIPAGVNEPASNPLNISRVRVNSWESAGSDKYFPGSLYDGNPGTFWHARYSTGSGHGRGESFVDIDLGSVQTISQIQIEKRLNAGQNIKAVRIFSHGEQGNTFPNGERIPADYPANVPQSNIDLDFAMTGWTHITEIESAGLGSSSTTSVNLRNPVAARYIRLGITNGTATSDDYTQVREVRAYGGSGSSSQTHAAIPNITTQPTDKSVPVNGSATLTISASVSKGTLSYQWFEVSSKTNVGGTAISSATGTSFNPPTSAAGTKFYYCRVTNTDNDVTGNKTSSVNSNAVSVTVVSALVAYGNVNGDGVINAADVTMLRRYIAATDKTAFLAVNSTFNLANADVNGDGKIDEVDVALLRRYLAATDPSTVLLGPQSP